MRHLWIFCSGTYQHIELDVTSAKPITIGPDKNYTLTVRSFPFTRGTIRIERMNDESRNEAGSGNDGESRNEAGSGNEGESVNEDGFGNDDECGSGLVVFQDQREEKKITEPDYLHLIDGPHTLSLFFADDPVDVEQYYVGHKQQLFFSNQDEQADVYKQDRAFVFTEEFYLHKAKGKWILFPEPRLFLNGHPVREETALEVGDVIFWPFMTIRFVEEDILLISSEEHFQTELACIEQPMSEMKKKYPQYRRTPRMNYELPEEKVNLSFPTQERDDQQRSLWISILPPLVMLLVIGIVAMVRPRGIFIIISVFMFATTLVTSTAYYLRDKKNTKRRKEKRRKIYVQYLQNKRQELHELAAKQKRVLSYHFPSFERMKYLTSQISDRIWERTLDSADFLHVRLGLGMVPASYELHLNSGDMANREIDDLLEQSQVMQDVYKEVKQAPITVNLAAGAMGLTGQESIVKNEIHQLVGQLAFFHSYHDLRFVFIFDEHDYTILPKKNMRIWNCSLPNLCATVNRWGSI